MFYDAETHSLLARERVELLRAQATGPHAEHRARRWLSNRLIAAGRRLAPESPQAHRHPAAAA